MIVFILCIHKFKVGTYISCPKKIDRDVHY